MTDSERLQASRSLNTWQQLFWLVLVLQSSCGGGTPTAQTAVGSFPTATRTGSSDQFYGFAVVGDTAATEYGMAPGDTVFEVRSDQVPLVVRSAVESLVEELGWTPICTRFFQAETGYLVMLQGVCPPSRMPGLTDDRLRFGAVGRDGIFLSRLLLPEAYSTVRVWCPAQRTWGGKPQDQLVPADRSCVYPLDVPYER